MEHLPHVKPFVLNQILASQYCKEKYVRDKKKQRKNKSNKPT